MAFEHRTRGAGDVILSADWNAMGDEIQRVGGLLAQDEKKESVTLPVPLRVFGRGAAKSPLSVAGGAAIGAAFAEKSAAPADGLIVEGSLGVGTPSPAGKLNVVHREEDASGGAVILGPTAASNLRLGYHKDYGWVQSHGGRPLRINPLGNDVSIGTGVLVQGDGDVGIGTPAPTAKLHVEGSAVLNGALTVRDGVRLAGGARQMLDLGGPESGIGTQGATQYYRTGGHFAWYRGGAHQDAALDPGGGSAQMVIREDGKVGIGTTDPQDRLEVKGPVRLLADSNAIRFTGAWSGFPDGVTDRAEISNDTGTYKTLMIVGNRSAGVGRRVSVWDRLEVNGSLEVTGVVRAQSVVATSPLVHRMYPGDPVVYQEIFDAKAKGAIRKMGNPSYDDTTWQSKPWFGRHLIRFGGNEQADADGAEVVVPAGYDTVWVRVLGDRWTAIKAFFRDGAREDLGLWTGGYRSANGYGPDGSLSDGYNDADHGIEGGGKVRVDLHQWVPIPAGRAGTLALVAKKNTNWDFWLSGLAFSRNPWTHAAQSAVGYHWALNGGSGAKWNNHDWNQDVLAELYPGKENELMVPVVPSGRDKLLYLVEHNNNWNGCGHTGISVNGTPVERFLSTYDNPFARHWNGKFYNRYVAARIPAALVGSERYLKVRIDLTKQNSPIYFREVGTHDLEVPGTL